MEKKISIREKYQPEITDIYYLLNQIGSGRIYGFPGNCSPADDELETNVDRLTKQINDLLDKIENDHA
jgi:hypothetical protein